MAAMGRAGREPVEVDKAVEADTVTALAAAVVAAVANVKPTKVAVVAEATARRG